MSYTVCQSAKTLECVYMIVMYISLQQFREWVFWCFSSGEHTSLIYIYMIILCCMTRNNQLIDCCVNWLLCIFLIDTYIGFQNGCCIKISWIISPVYVCFVKNRVPSHLEEALAEGENTRADNKSWLPRVSHITNVWVTLQSHGCGMRESKCWQWFMTHTSESCHKRMSHVTRHVWDTQECRCWQWVMSHMSESCHERMSHVTTPCLWSAKMQVLTMNHGTHKWVMSRANASSDTPCLR